MSTLIAIGVVILIGWALTDVFIAGTRLRTLRADAKAQALPQQTNCFPISGETVAPGWGCCSCRTYNSIDRECCRWCQHVRCQPTGDSGGGL